MLRLLFCVYCLSVAPVTAADSSLCRSSFLGPSAQIEWIHDAADAEYLFPNEKRSYVAIPLYRRAPPGVHISVGTERGFIGFGLNAKAGSLILIDHSEDIVRFNQLNIALLILAQKGDLQDYRFLRTTASYEQIVERIKGLKFNHPYLALLGDRSHLEFFRSYTLAVPDPGEAPAFQRVSLDFAADLPQVRKEDLTLQTIFEGNLGAHFATNYLQNKNMFVKIQDAALGGKISATRLDLNDTTSVSHLVQKLKSDQQEISVIDLSNAYWPQYMPHVDKVLRPWFQIAGGQSLFIFTYRKNGFYAMSEISGWPAEEKKMAHDWRYFGYTFAEIERHTRYFRTSIMATIEDLNADTIGLQRNRPTIVTLNGQSLIGDRPASGLLAEVQNFLRELRN